MTITFYITESTRKDKKVKIKVRLRDGRDINLYGVTGKKILPENWDKKNHRIKPDSIFRDKQACKEYLRDMEDFIESNYHRDRRAGKINSDWLSQAIIAYDDELDGKPGDPRTLFEFVRQFIDTAGQRKDGRGDMPVSYKQVREYERTFHYLKKYSEDKRKNVDFNDIDLEFYRSWIEFMEKQGLALNTIGKKVQTLKIFLNAAALEPDKYRINPIYKSGKFKSLKEESDTIYLDESELDKLFKLDLSKTPGQERVRDQFLIAAWTGCRFGDLDQVTKDNIKDGIIQVIQTKTGTRVPIPMHPIVKVILEKYDYSFPNLIENQPFNRSLKEVAKKAKINTAVHKGITKGGKRISEKYEKWQLISSHAARRSFATNLYKSGFPSISIMKITGHKTEAAFLKYIRVTPEDHAKLLQMHWEKNSEHLRVV